MQHPLRPGSFAGVGSVCLCMIVRDEEAVIERCLASVRDVIDTWVICDTGSVDGTPELVAGALDGIPGELHHHEWRDFAHNRSALMALAHGRADHLLLMDADWTLEVAPGALGELTADAYMVRHTGHTEFHNKRIVSGRIPWRYVGATHEYITSPDERSCERLDGVSIHIHDVGGMRTGRWERDVGLLEGAGDPRSVFYLGQSLRDLGHHRGDRALLDRARATYERRAAMTGWDEETYCALHEAGALAAEVGEWPAAMDLYVRAWEFRPQRLEAVYDLVVGLRERERWHTALRFASLDGEVPADDLHVAPWVYAWGLAFERSIALYWVGHFDECRRVCDELLARADLPEAHRARTAENRRLALEAHAERLAAPVLEELRS